MIYLLQHYRLDENDDEKDIKTVGIFSSQSLAEEAIEHLKSKPGFRDHPGRFSIGPYVVDKVYWEDGFGVE